MALLSINVTRNNTVRNLAISNAPLSKCHVFRGIDSKADCTFVKHVATTVLLQILVCWCVVSTASHTHRRNEKGSWCRPVGQLGFFWRPKRIIP